MFKLARRSYFDDLFNDFFKESTTNNGLLKTDILETEESYILKVDVPGFLKEEISVLLKDGYLTITATKNKDEKSEDSTYIRRERIQTTSARKFYVGDNITEDNINAKLENGILIVNLLKVKEEEKKESQIEIK